MAFITAFSECYGCRRPFTYNPMRVPSVLVNGSREPVCLSCIERVNPTRIAKGLAPIVPLPGAYEAADESEVLFDFND